MSPKERLIEELSSVPVNVLRIRRLCLETPGLIASAGTRTRIWSLLLLGSDHINTSCTDIPLPTESCLEQHVLEADVRRTRADMEEFRSTAWRYAITAILQSFCLKHAIQYKQGMNEVLAPFIYIQAPPKSSSLPFSLFEAFLFRYLERYFCLDDSSFLFKSFRLFQILLVFHDPQLALHLEENDFLPELYAPSWFLTLFSRALPMKHVLRLWDMMIAVDDPAFTFFIGLCLLRRRRTDLLLASGDVIPEIISIVGLVLESEEDVDAVVTDALQAYKQTPRCFLRNLRLCCVSNADLNPSARYANPTTAFSVTTNQKQKSGKQMNASSGSARLELKSNLADASSSSSRSAYANRRQDIAMAEQSVRQCVVISPHELVSHLAPLVTTFAAADKSHGKDIDTSKGTLLSVGTGSNPLGLEKENITQSRESTSTMRQFVVIDVRSDEDVAALGGGVLPKAIRMDPDFLDRPDALDAWLQHFDSMKGCCSICIIDVPPSRQSGFSLLRRLLLGDGDGLSDYAQYSGAVGSSTKSVGGVRYSYLDPESPFAEYEMKAVAEDKSRIGVQLAKILYAANFPYVCVLEGGLYGLVRQLMASRGTVEPVMINHDHEQYTAYLSRHGYLSDDSLDREAGVKKPDGSTNDMKVDGMIDIRNLSTLDKVKIAHQVAVRSAHTHMASVLLEKIKKLEYG